MATELSGIFQSKQTLGVFLALLGAVFLSLGAQFQSRGLNKVETLTGKTASTGLSLQHIARLFKRPSWIFGTSFLGLATVLQLGSLGLAPIILVQPIGVLALLITAILNAKISRFSLGSKVRFAIALSVVGVTVFVLIAATVAKDRTVTDEKLKSVLIIFLFVLLPILILYVFLRGRAGALSYILSAGILYGFVATFAKTTIGRFQQQQFDLLTWLSLAALLSGVLLGMIFVQNAYSSGPPDLVIAGLTVIDPLVAVLIGIVVLGEASNASLWQLSGFIVAGFTAIFGVFYLAKYHPQSGFDSLHKVPAGLIAADSEGSLTAASQGSQENLSAGVSINISGHVSGHTSEQPSAHSSEPTSEQTSEQTSAHPSERRC